MENLEAVFARIRGVLGVKTDKQMCEILGIQYGTLDNWKARKKIPKARILEIANKLNVSPEYLNGNLSFSNNVNSVILGGSNFGSFTNNHNINITNNHGNTSKREKELEALKKNNPDREYKNIDDIKERLGLGTNDQLAKLFRMDVGEIFRMQKEEAKIPEDMQHAARVMEYELYKLKMNFGGMDMDKNWGYINYESAHIQVVGDKLELMVKLALYANKEFVEQVLARLNEIERLSKF